MIKFDVNTLRDVAAATSREWLETNGLGGFSSSTVIGLNTRRYHGLLTAATHPPVGRIVILSKLEEALIIDGRRYELSANQYPGVIYPRGFEFQTQFRLDPFPIFTYEVEGVTVEKSVVMVQGENTIVVRYSVDVEQPGSIKLEVRPLIAFRDYHSTTHENGALNSHLELSEGQITVKPYPDLPTLNFAHDVCEIDKTGYWYRNFQYSIERERGLDFAEDLFSPFSFTFDFDNARPVRIIASTEQQNIQQADSHIDAEIKRRGTSGGSLLASMTAAADQFIVERGSGKTVVAGYHWFSDWGRDTMIALPGLMLATGKYETAKSVLLEFAKHVDMGMLPNRFPDAGETAEYNTVDATLWYFEAIRSLLQYTGDYEFIRENLYAVLKDILEWHISGTRFNIHVDADGLLQSGAPGVQLTWMDAKVGDRVITPRHGKPVEIQALWYNALRTMETLAERFGEPVEQVKFGQLAAKAKQSFNELFWNDEGGYLYDVVNGDFRDASIRPNQVLAISLEHSMVPRDRAEKILSIVELELLTPRGLRTLSRRDAQYAGVYRGDGAARDSVYHQGTVWPWLMEPFVAAYRKTFGPEAAQRFGSEWLAGFEEHLTQACLGQVSEIFDGDAPYTPRGCAAQAWSVAAVLRAAVEVGAEKQIVQATSGASA